MKILITESQYKILEETCDNLPNEIKENGYSENILSLKDLAELVGRMGYDEETVGHIFSLLRNARKVSGDEGVVELFHDMTDRRIEPISRGRYIFIY